MFGLAAKRRVIRRWTVNVCEVVKSRIVCAVWNRCKVCQRWIENRNPASRCSSLRSRWLARIHTQSTRLWRQLDRCRFRKNEIIIEHRDATDVGFSFGDWWNLSTSKQIGYSFLSRSHYLECQSLRNFDSSPEATRWIFRSFKVYCVRLDVVVLI